MTPQEIFEYKLGWSPGISVAIHSDLDWKAKNWCRKNLDRQYWAMDLYTDVYEHTFRFEHEHHAKQFAIEFKEWLTCV